MDKVINQSHIGSQLQGQDQQEFSVGQTTPREMGILAYLYP